MKNLFLEIFLYIKNNILLLMFLNISTYLCMLLATKIKNKENIKDFLPENHHKKKHISRAGGIVIGIFGLLGGLLYSPLIFFSGLGSFILGLIDDLMKKKKGLKNKIRLLIWSAIGLYIAIFKYINSGSSIIIPFVGPVNFGILYIPFIVFIVVGTINGVNMTDGLDGLVTFPLILNFLFISFVALSKNNINIFNYSIFIIGILMIFLKFNLNPAKLLMGDSGSTFLGTILAHLYIHLSIEFLLPIVGFVFVINVTSSFIQIFSIRIFKKKTFKMAPLHHHFELTGYKENTIVYCFWIITFLFFICGYYMLCYFI